MNCSHGPVQALEIIEGPRQARQEKTVEIVDAEFEEIGPQRETAKHEVVPMTPSPREQQVVIEEVKQIETKQSSKYDYIDDIAFEEVGPQQKTYATKQEGTTIIEATHQPQREAKPVEIIEAEFTEVEAPSAAATQSCLTAGT